MDDKPLNKEQLEAFAREAAKTIKTDSDLNDFRQMLTKVTVDTPRNREGSFEPQLVKKNQTRMALT